MVDTHRTRTGAPRIQNATTVLDLLCGKHVLRVEEVDSFLDGFLIIRAKQLVVAINRGPTFY